MLTRTAESPNASGQPSRTSEVESGGSSAGPATSTLANGSRQPFISVCPLLLMLVATALGIVIDRQLIPLDSSFWITLALGSITIASLCVRRSAICVLAVLGGLACFAAGWHHVLWTDRPAFDPEASLTDLPVLTHVRGVITEVDGLHRAAPFSRDAPERISTRLSVFITSISDGRAWRPASAGAQVTVTGDRTDLLAGQPVEAAGKASRIAAPRNPGEFDYQDFLRSKGIGVRLTIESPEGIFVDPSGTNWWSWYWLGKVRSACRARLTERLDPATAPLAAALILGQRDEIDPEVIDAFLRTGTTHLLAISGLQLQALALAVCWLFRLAGFPRQLVYSSVGMVTLGYALLVGLAPSVVRSAVMTISFCLAACVARPTRPSNTLALAGLVTIWWNPFHLFDVGCQLSFLAIAALIWLVPLGRQGLAAVGSATAPRLWGPLTPVQKLRRRFEPAWRRHARTAVRWIGLGVLTSLIVWLAALPLVANRFHLVSPIGVLLNIPLIPLTSLALLLGASGLGLGFVWIPLGVPLIHAADLLLKVSESIVLWGARQPWGYQFVVGPSWETVLVFYVFLGLATVWTLTRPAMPRPAIGDVFRRAAPWMAVAASLLAGWLVTWPTARSDSIEGEVLAVEHGLAVLLRLPDGHTMLYDCGRMGDPSVGRRIIAPAIWSKGLNRIDTVYLSHSDQDHYNGLSDLLDRFRIGEIVIPPGFGGEQNPDATALLDAARNRGIPVRTIAAPATWSRADCQFRILHPRADWHPESTDNARSLVLDVAYQGRHLLLTGDLDQLGLVTLASQPRPEPIDLLLAPHHGGKSANPAWFYDWARPATVVVSQRMQAPGTNDALTLLDRRGIPVLRTWQRGAIHFQWSSDRILTEGFLDQRDQPRSLPRSR